MSKTTQKQKQLWEDIKPILKQNPTGIEVEELYKQLNAHKYNSQFVCQFIDSMHKEHCLIAYLSSNPPKITLRPGKDANKLKKLTSEQYNVYNYIEKSRTEGIVMSRLSQGCNISSAKCKSIMTKVLEKVGLTSKFTNPRTFQVFYHATSFKPPEHVTTKSSKFYTEKGHIDDVWLNDIMTVIVHKIKTSDSIKGISSLELQQIIKESGLTTDINGLPINDIDAVIRLLLYEKKIDIIASSVPMHELDKYLTHSKNTFYHLMQSIQNIRNKQKDKNHKIEDAKIKKIKKRKFEDALGHEEHRKLSKKRKLNNAKKIVIGSGSDDDMDKKPRNDSNNGVFIWTNDNKNKKEDKNGNEEEDIDPEAENIRKYGEIKFRYNKYEYESPVSAIPCQSCPVVSTCSDDGIINPIECPYLNAWLNLF